jgi:hypothetical protein
LGFAHQAMLGFAMLGFAMLFVSPKGNSYTRFGMHVHVHVLALA